MMDALKKMLDEYRIPPVIEIKTKFDKTRLPKAEEVLLARLQEKKLPIRPDMRIAITGGSRGIADYPAVMRAAVRYIKACGAVPFIVPAMGSHGGATAEGQVEVLKNLGITEETVGAPIYSSMDVVVLLLILYPVFACKYSKFSALFLNSAENLYLFKTIYM